MMSSKKYPAPALRQSERGFTVFEFAVVFVIAAIILVIMWVNSQFFVTQVRVMKVKEEQALLKRALENYHADYASYPPNDVKLAALDSPTAYLASLPEDPFSGVTNNNYVYISRPGGGYDWILISPGPDGVMDFGSTGLPEVMTSALAESRRSSQANGGTATIQLPLHKNLFKQYITSIQYDPTNGADSAGDIITLSSR
jgi:type II secretory pathway pseudopilin PulG